MRTKWSAKLLCLSIKAKKITDCLSGKNVLGVVHVLTVCVCVCDVIQFSSHTPKIHRLGLRFIRHCKLKCENNTSFFFNMWHCDVELILYGGQDDFGFSKFADLVKLPMPNRICIFIISKCCFWCFVLHSDCDSTAPSGSCNTPQPP